MLIIATDFGQLASDTSRVWCSGGIFIWLILHFSVRCHWSSAKTQNPKSLHWHYIVCHLQKSHKDRQAVPSPQILMSSVSKRSSKFSIISKPFLQRFPTPCPNTASFLRFVSRLHIVSLGLSFSVENAYLPVLCSCQNI